MMSQPLNLKTISLDETHGDETLVNELLTSHPMEKIDIGNYGSFDISLFIESLPQIGSKLKILNLYNGHGNIGKFGDLSNISLILNTCLSLEELNISYNTLDTESIDYLCENLTPNILKLDIEI